MSKTAQRYISKALIHLPLEHSKEKVEFDEQLSKAEARKELSSRGFDIGLIYDNEENEVLEVRAQR